MSRIKDNLDTLQQQLPPDVTLVAVTKYATLEQMIEAYEWGVRDFGENKIQDWERKLVDLPPEVAYGVRWHFLGHLQKNKAKHTVGGKIHLIHSVDSVALAQKLAILNEGAGTRQDVLLQVNISREPQKTGFLEEDLISAFPQIMDLSCLRLQGLMTIAPNTDNAAERHACFSRLHALRDMLSNQFSIPLPHLSMGMSDDFHHAIECGATIIRIGSHIFGA
jgi:pyridoxal phosphate enzyme (YggS family)